MSDVKRRKGRNKFWLKERIILEFKNVIIPKNPRPKRIFIRKYYNYLERAIDNSNEITWHELYATAKLDFEEICKEPPIWTFDKFVKDLKIYFENGEDLNPTALSVNHNNWYTQLRRAEKNGMFNREDVFAALGLKYQDFIKLKKKYPNKESVREGLIKVYGLNHFHTLTPKVVREEDFPLYLALLEYGSNFEEGCTNIGFKLSKRDEVTPMYLVTLEEKRKYCVIFGYEFEAILNNIFILLKQPFKRNNLIIKGVKPDFTYNEDEIWVDAKLSTKGINSILNDRKKSYHTKARKVIYVYLVESVKLLKDRPSNVEVYHVSFFINQLKNSRQKSEIVGGLKLINKVISNLGIDYTKPNG